MMLRNNKGFTAIEVMIGIGLMAILTTVIVSTQLMVTKDQMKLTTQLEDSIDTKLAERMMFMDLNGIEPSYNNLTVLDEAGNKFFDYYPDVPANALKKTLERNLSLTLDGRKEFFIMTQDHSAGSMMNYDPVAAYDVGAAPDDFNVSAELKFSSVNRNNWVKAPASRPGFWVDGKALMFDTPARLRAMDPITGNVNMQIAPRSPVFVGYVQGQSLTMDSTIANLIDTTHPQTGVQIKDADTFLRSAPSIGGGQTLIRLRAVKIVKYYLSPYEDSRLEKTPANLYRAVYTNGQWSSPTLMANKVDDLSFKRDSVLKKLIYFRVNKVKSKQDLSSNPASGS